MPPRSKLTHFLCLPLCTPASRPALQTAVQSFTTDVTSIRTAENPIGIPAEAIRPVGTLHLTLGVMSLLTPKRVQAARESLQALDIGAFLRVARADVGGGEGGLQVTLRGLKAMRSDQSTSVLYTSPVDPDGTIQRFCLLLQSTFKDLLVSNDRPLLLHATILHTMHALGVRSGASSSGHAGKKLEFAPDVREILRRYEDRTWMENVRIERVAICKMGARVCEGEVKYLEEFGTDLP